MDCSPPGSSVLWILQAGILERVAPHLGDLPDPWIEPESPMSPALAGGFSTMVTTWEAPVIIITITKTEVNIYDALPARHSPEGLTHAVSALGSPGGLGERH